ncbi:hypothetical protein F510_0847 [Anoxybacillus gonensis]|nr:hypothetical protein F510_0847 [Anoxybacillus gonensis]
MQNKKAAVNVVFFITNVYIFDAGFSSYVSKEKNEQMKEGDGKNGTYRIVI